MLLLLLLDSTACSAAPVAQILAATDPALYYSDYNWALRSSGAMAASNPGAFVKLRFTGSHCVLLLDTSSNAAAAITLGWQLDDGPWQFWTNDAATHPASNQTRVAVSGSAPLPALPVVAGGPTEHSLRVYLYQSDETKDRWSGDSKSGGGSYLLVTGVALDAKAALLPPLGLHPARMIAYGDSITEGINAQLFDFHSGTGCSSGKVNAAAPKSWSFGVAEALGAELSNCAYAAQGYQTMNSLGYGGVPPLVHGGAEGALSAWDKIDATHSRLPAIAQRPPEHVFSAQGFNDQVAIGESSAILLPPRLPLVDASIG